MKYNLGNNLTIGNGLTKSLATCAIAAATIPLFIITCVAGVKLGNLYSYLPFVVLGSSSISIASIWFFSRTHKPDSISNKKLATLENRVAILEQRIINAEIVDDFESRLAEKEVERRSQTNLNELSEEPIQLRQ